MASLRRTRTRTGTPTPTTTIANRCQPSKMEHAEYSIDHTWPYCFVVIPQG
jgi:hypothetical protein